MIASDLIYEKDIRIYNETNQFIIKKKSSSSYFSLSKYGNGNKLFHLDKIGTEYNTNTNIPYVETFSIVGALTCPGTNYLMVVSKANLVGLFLKSKIHQIEEIDFLPFESTAEDHLERNNNYFEMISDFLKSNKLYFSDAYNLTASVSENLNKPKMLKSVFINTIKSEYCWNYHFLNSIEYNADFENTKENFLYPIINGYIGKRLIGCYEKEFDYMIVARKDCRRSGMRFLTRGCDEQGNAANSVEIEQILTLFEEDNYHVLSYIQIRGSIPLLWRQPSEMNFKPKIYPVKDYAKQVSVCKKHLSSLVSNYDKVTMVNLIEKKGDQKIIGELFENVSNDLRDEFSHNFVWFDFHKECSKMKYENLNKLLTISSVAGALLNYDFTHIQVPSIFNFYEEIDPEGVCIVSQQMGVLRTNCIDSLDRTNVVQTLFARNVLHQMLHRTQIKKIDTLIDAFEPFRTHFEKVFRLLWADNGDYISKSYSGTPAQKGDFTRTGKRTMKGALKDAYIGSSRFYLNNFRDGYKQDCHDYFLGKISPYKFITRKNLTFVKLFIPSLLCLSLLLFLLIAHLISYFTQKDKFIEVCIFLASFGICLKTLSITMKNNMYDKPSSS